MIDLLRERNLYAQGEMQYNIYGYAKLKFNIKCQK